MTSAPAILWETFGLTGLASAAAWAAAFLFILAGIVRRIRWTSWMLAAVAAAAGVVLALATSESIRSIEVDRSAEVLAAEAAGAKAAQEKLRGRAANVRFAEDTAADQADVAGVTKAEEKGAYERAVEEELAKIPAYRTRGKKARAGGKAAASAADGAAANTDAAAGETPAAEAEPERYVRKLPESQLVVADRFDRGNRAAAWTALFVSLGLAGVEYVRRFNSTFDPVWPLPLAGTPIDGFAEKEHVVPLPPGSIEAAPRWLEAVTRKGESFLVFAASDLLPERSELPRISAGPIRLSTPVRKFSAAELAADLSLLETAFESGWFGRSSCMIVGEPAAGEVLSRFAALLESRRQCRAAAGCTLDIVWALNAKPPAEAAARIARLAEATNIRWVRRTADEKDCVIT